MSQLFEINHSFSILNFTYDRTLQSIFVLKIKQFLKNLVYLDNIFLNYEDFLQYSESFEKRFICLADFFLIFFLIC